MKSITKEQIFTLLFILSGIIVAIILAPKNKFFWYNFVWFWVPQAAILGLLTILRFRPAIIGGCGLILSVYLALYGAWMFSLPPREALAWFGYLFPLPGAAIGSVLAGIYSKKRNTQNALTSMLNSSALTFFGISINLIIICNTAMYCSCLSWLL